MAVACRQTDRDEQMSMQTHTRRASCMQPTLILSTLEKWKQESP